MNNNKPKELISEYDVTKKMLDKIRLLTENDEGGDVISPTPSDSIFIDEYKKIRDSVDPRLQITKFKIYPNDRDVQFDGRLDSGINFFMSVKAMKLSISITDSSGNSTRIYLDDDLMTVIKKLDGYYDNWVREWSQKLATEYKAKG
jgi:hypothetical protein